MDDLGLVFKVTWLFIVKWWRWLSLSSLLPYMLCICPCELCRLLPTKFYGLFILPCFTLPHLISFHCKTVDSAASDSSLKRLEIQELRPAGFTWLVHRNEQYYSETISHRSSRGFRSTFTSWEPGWGWKICYWSQRKTQFNKLGKSGDNKFGTKCRYPHSRACSVKKVETGHKSLRQQMCRFYLKMNHKIRQKDAILNWNCI